MMAKSYKRILLTAFVVALPAFAGCERADQISSLSARELESVRVQASTLSSDTARLVRRAMLAKDSTVWAWTSPGQELTLTIGKYRLFVPKSAVKNSTLFRMRLVNDGTIKVQLKAWDSNLTPVTTFLVPLTLTLPYDEAQSVTDPSSLLIANVAADGSNKILELVNSSVDQQNKIVSGNITHFSDWALAELSKEFIIGID